MSKKPCIECGKECEILPVMLGDAFTLTYLRVCSSDCMFIIAYEYLHSICHHKDFRNKLYDMQNEEDKKERDEYVDFTTKQFLEDFRRNLDANPQMLSTPMPENMLKMFADAPQIPLRGETMRFTRPSKEDKIKWQTKHVERLKTDLEEAMKDLEKLQNER